MRISDWSSDVCSSDLEEKQEIDAALTFSSKEILQSIDFEKMSAAELAAAKQAIQAMRLPIMEVPTRRFRAGGSNRADLRATLRAALRQGGDTIPLRWKQPRHRHPPLVVLCDISGSMSRYSRMLLHFMHAVTNDRDRVHSRSEEHTSELQSLMRISYAVFCLKKKITIQTTLL